MFLIIFSISLLIANIYCFFSKKYLYLFIPCMLFLPKYYGFEINESLPLITVTRLMYLVLFLYAFINRRRNLSIKSINIKAIPKHYLFIAGYFFFRIISNLHYITTYNQAAKTIFELVFEQMLLLIAVWYLSPTREEINKLIKVCIYAAVFMFISGYFESILTIKPFTLLYTVNRRMMNYALFRLGLLRCCTTLGAPTIYGNMCIFFIPLIIYTYRQTLQKRYIIFLLLDCLAIIHSGCRSDILFALLIFGVYVIREMYISKEYKRLFINISVIVCSLFIYIGTMCLVSERLNYYYIGTAKSVLNEVGFSFDLNEGAPEGSGGYGINEDGKASRLDQFSGIPYVLTKNPIWGLGSGAQNRREIYYKWKGNWIPSTTYDLGYVEIIADEGLLGLIAHICYFYALCMLIRRKNKYISPFSAQFITLKYSLLLVYLLCLFSNSNIYPILTFISLITLF